MRTINDLTKLPHRVYVYLADEKTADRFLADAVKEGYTYEDGTKLSERRTDDFYAINKNKTLCFINGIGRIAFQCGSENLIRVDYRKYINDEKDYFFHS